MRNWICRPFPSLLLLFAACGAAPSAPIDQKIHTATAPTDEDQAIISSRHADVPEATAASGRIVFLKAGSIWIMDPDGKNVEQLTVRSLDATDEAPCVSPDGSLLAYASAKEGQSKLYVQSMEDMIPNPITEGVDSQPAFSPDGKWIAFMRGDSRERMDLYTIGVGGETPPQLLLEGDDDHPEFVGAPIWTPDGKSIVFSADRRNHQGSVLWQLSLQSLALEPLTSPVENADWIVDKSPRFSPDGSTIVFASNRHANSRDHATDFDVYTIAAKGEALRRLTDDPGTVASPVYSQDGVRLYFASTRIRESGFEWEIYTMAAQGGKQRRLSRDAQPENYAPFVTTPNAGR